MAVEKLPPSDDMDHSQQLDLVDTLEDHPDTRRMIKVPSPNNESTLILGESRDHPHKPVAAMACLREEGS